MTIVFVTDPRFSVDFSMFAERKESENLVFSQKVQRVVTFPFQLIRFTFIAIPKSSYTTLRYSWTSFKHIALGCYGSLEDFRPPEDIYLVVFRVVFWALAVFWCFTTTTLRLIIEQINPPSNQFLRELAGEEINVEHLKIKDSEIDISNVPKTVTIDTLMTMFENINFSDPKKPGYVARTSRQEGSTIYTETELKAALKIFIHNVKNRIPFLGTPPAYDTPLLMAFYKQIEDAVRFSIHKANKRLEEFQNKYGTDPTQYEADQVRQYKNLLEDIARIVLNLAFAGFHCGTRYMGESLGIYYSLEGSNTSQDGTLEDIIREFLAYKRAEIAQKQVQHHLGNDVHALTNYMQNLGGPLGLPGTHNVVEHLSRSFDINKYLELFFAEYTVDLIIDTVQEQVKNSQNLREKITDWLKDQVGEWKQDAYDFEKVREIQDILDRKDENSSLPDEFQQFQNLIIYLKEQKVTWPSHANWEAFLDELFALDQAKKWFKDHFGDLKNPVAFARKKQQLKTLDEVILRQIREAIVEGKELPMDLINARCSQQRKIQEIRNILPTMQKETLSRIFEGKIPLETAIKNHYDLERKEEFLSALNLENMATDGLSSAILEWILVSQKILLPQNPTG